VRLTGAARATVFAAEEDFGIATVEAQACGTPVIAFGRGGARDILVAPPAPAPTGLFFAEQTAESLAAAVAEFEGRAGEFSPEACRRNAERFSRARFRDAMKALVDGLLADREEGRRGDLWRGGGHAVLADPGDARQDAGAF
jgi:glycosyltransferase involved in cell wall biosynthesis